MSARTNIEWCDSSVNPVMGCDGCELWTHERQTCYAGLLHRQYGRSNKGYADSFDIPELFPGRMHEAAKWKDLAGTDRQSKPWLNGMPRTIFVSDMGDALSRDVPFEYLREEIVHVANSDAGKRHAWLWLTKRPTRMRLFSYWLLEQGIGWPQNLHPMTSITGSQSDKRASSLADVDSGDAIKAISFEPLWDEPNWDYVLDIKDHKATGKRSIQWAIFGGESGHQAMSTDIDVIRRGIEACRRLDIPVFVKQLGTKPVGITLEGNDFHNANPELWPEDIRVREMPSLTHQLSTKGH